MRKSVQIDLKTNFSDWKWVELDFCIPGSSILLVCQSAYHKTYSPGLFDMQ